MEWVYLPETNSWEEILKRPAKDFRALEDLVDGVFKNVRSEGDTALKEYTRTFDGATLEEIRVGPEEVAAAGQAVSPQLKEAIELAYENIYAFHAAQRTGPVRVNTRTGVSCWMEKRPISRVGLYIPGGSAPLFSTVLMLAIPAMIAGCTEIVLCSPPDTEGNLHPAILYAASRCGVTTICRVGGIQAVAAMTYGTESVPKTFKIFGPGNQYVTAAKQWASRLGVAIDMPAGPSELLVVADASAVPEFIASDLLSQAEHGADSQVILLTDDPDIQEAVDNALEAQLAKLPRQEIARSAMANSRGIVLKDREAITDMVNTYAPEHLIIAHKEEAFMLEHIQNAGSVFLGNYTPESAGDYASGTNHTLPTNGYARQYSGVNLGSYTKSITYQRITPEGLQGIGPAVETMARAEGLQAHANAVTLRLNTLNKVQ
ncbi:histidinol dehydrogenase [Robiginitalea aurantiaca]|uniref:Histidinol dehydrogenase n=1 Tax=Robiginitalea aurantiaca TaxID=3056915 RepID=A0ABT7WFU2_9FLAO|nr:histidinol dehydrogenase [Robiginitalea aurantiaca]MDM9631789.1 histidinol dehydrogenase [Robiginitalea aurantiaca]